MAQNKEEVIFRLCEYAVGLTDAHSFESWLYANNDIVESLLNQELFYELLETNYSNFAEQISARRLLSQYIKTEHSSLWGEKQNEAKQKLISLIEGGFKGVTLGDGITIHQAMMLDDRASDEECLKARELDTEKSWQEITDKTIEGFNQLTFLDNKGYCFYIPAYMKWWVKYCDEFPYSDTPEYVVYSLTSGVESGKCRIKNLSEQQKPPALSFIYFAAINDEYNSEKCISKLISLDVDLGKIKIE